MAQKSFELGKLQFRSAMNRYHQHYNNASYAKAIKDKSNAYANALINEALALCGDPSYSLSDRLWSQDAYKFLERFVR